MTAKIAPTWITAVKAVTESESVCRPRIRSVMVRWPVLDTGRNSVSPSTTPSTAACARSTVVVSRREVSATLSVQLVGEDGAMFVRVWEYDVLPERAEEFERVSRGDGPWAALFARADGFAGTELFRSVEA